MSSHALTCEAVAVMGSSRARAAAAHWNSTRCDHPFGGEAPGDHRLRRGVEAAAEIVRRPGARRAQHFGKEAVRLLWHRQDAVAKAEDGAPGGPLQPHERTGREVHSHR